MAYNLNQRGCKLEPTCKVRGDYDENIDHMLIQCRVAREIWSLALQGAEIELDQNSSAIINLLRSVLDATHGSSRSMFPLFLGWRIWKSWTKLSLRTNENIIHTINCAIRDLNIWQEATTMDMNPMHGIASSIPTNIAEIPPTICRALLHCGCFMEVSYR